jgi:hypothetical protein
MYSLFCGHTQFPIYYNYVCIYITYSNFVNKQVRSWDLIYDQVSNKSLK